MTKEEIRRCCQIPESVLSAYEHWNLKGEQADKEKQQYDEEDIRKLGLIMTLSEAGFKMSQIECYMRLAEKNSTEAKRKEILERQRHDLLQQVHDLERKIEKLDYLRYQMNR